jgi:hypothetical protein
MALNFPDTPADGTVFQNWTWSAATGAWLPSSTVGSGIIVSDTPPASPTAGALWWESDTGTLYVYYNDGSSSQWVQVLAGAPPKTGAFQVDRGGTTQTGTAGADLKITWVNAPINNDSWFNLTNGRYTPQVAGTYVFSLSVSCVPGTAGESCQAELFKNGTKTKVGTYNSTNGPAISTVTAAIAMNGTTDFVEAYCYLPVGQTIMQGTVNGVHFQGWRVGA